MTSDRPHEAVQDAGSSAHVTPSSANSSSNALDTVFNFSQLEGKDAGQQVRQYNKYNAVCLWMNTFAAGHSQPHDGNSCQYQGGSGGSTVRECHQAHGTTLSITLSMS